MSNELYVTARLTIHDGRIDAFTAANGCIELEHYRDSAVVLEHISNLGDAFGALLAASDLEVSIFGEPSQELLDATEEIPTTVYRFHRGT